MNTYNQFAFPQEFCDFKPQASDSFVVTFLEAGV